MISSSFRVPYSVGCICPLEIALPAQAVTVRLSIRLFQARSPGIRSQRVSVQVLKQTQQLQQSCTDGQRKPNHRQGGPSTPSVPAVHPPPCISLIQNNKKEVENPKQECRTQSQESRKWTQDMTFWGMGETYSKRYTPNDTNSKHLIPQSSRYQALKHSIRNTRLCCTVVIVQ